MILSILTVIKNDAKRLSEWVYFHKKVHDVDRFVFYTDFPEDNSIEVLDSLKKEYPIEHFPTRMDNPYKHANWGRGRDFTYFGGRHVDALTRGSVYLKDKSDWIAIFDVDEFVVPNQDKRLKDVLKDMTERLYIPCYVFKPPFDVNKSVVDQCFYRWSDEERKRNGSGGSGKSVFRTDRYLNTTVCSHYGPFPDNTIPEIDCVDLKLQHFQNKMVHANKHYDFFDDSIVKYFKDK